MAQTLSLTWGDEAILHLESASDPWNIQMEIGDTQRIDPDGLEAAVHAACMAHPICARASCSRLPIRGSTTGRSSTTCPACRSPSSTAPTTQRWPDCAPTSTRRRSRCTRRRSFVCKSPADRTETSSRSMRRMPRSTASACCGCSARSPTHIGARPNPPPPLPLEEARDLKKQLRAKSYSEFADRALEGGRKLKDAATPPARVAPDSHGRPNRIGFRAPHDRARAGR